MIEFWFNRRHRILWVRCDLPLSPANLDRLDSMLVAFIAREGTMDTILDLRRLPAAVFDASTVVERGRRPSRMPGKRRVMMVASDAYADLLRLYAEEQKNSGDRPPDIVRTPQEAFALLGIRTATFEPVADLDQEART